MVAPPDGCCFVNWLRNHDELDLEGIGERNKRQVEAASVRRGHHCLQRLHYRGGALLRQADIEIFIKPKILNPDAILLGEVDVEVEDYRHYFGRGDRLQMVLNYEAASVRRGHHCLQRLHYRGGALLRQADIEIFIISLCQPGAAARHPGSEGVAGNGGPAGRMLLRQLAASSIGASRRRTPRW
jgi:hypothetical protein